MTASWIVPLVLDDIVRHPPGSAGRISIALRASVSTLAVVAAFAAMFIILLAAGWPPAPALIQPN